MGEDAMVGACRCLCSIPGPLQTVQRAELWGVDNLGVVRHVGRLLDGKGTSRPAELVEDGDLILLIERMLRLRGLDTVRITKIKGHADEAMVRDGGVRELDGLCNNGADEAADFGRRRVHWGVIDARCNFAGVCSRWRHVVLVLHLFFFAISRAVVNHEGKSGTFVDPMVWSAGGIPKRRKVEHAVRDGAFQPGPAGIWDGEWVVVAATPVTCHDIAAWSYSVGMLVKWVALLSTLHWPQGGADLVSGVFLLLRFSFCATSGLVRGLIWRRLSHDTRH